jgi:hypothetical protein
MILVLRGSPLYAPESGAIIGFQEQLYDVLLAVHLSDGSMQIYARPR